MFSAARLRPAAHTGVSSDTPEKRQKLSAECAGTHSRERPCARNRQSLSRWGVDRMELLLFPLPLPGGFRKLQRLAKRKARKEKLVKCVLAPRRGRHHPPRNGSCKFAEEHSVPEGKPKSALAPIRRPPSRGGPLHRSAPNAFLFGPCTARFLFGKTEKKMGGACPADTPP